jgi:hypothetical protein
VSRDLVTGLFSLFGSITPLSAVLGMSLMKIHLQTKPPNQWAPGSMPHLALVGPGALPRGRSAAAGTALLSAMCKEFGPRGRTAL